MLMKKKILSTVAAMTLVAGVIGGAGAVKAEERTSLSKSGETEISYSSSTGVPANTGNYGATLNESANQIGTASIDVFAQADEATVTHVYAVTYKSNALKFKITGTKVIWNPNTKKYEYASDSAPAWNALTADTTDKITVYNYSDLAIKVYATGTVEADYSDITITTDKPNETNALSIGSAAVDNSNNTITGNQVGVEGTTQSGDIKVTVGSDADSKGPANISKINKTDATTKIGTVTINVNKAE